MYGFFLTLLVLDGIFLSVVILLQAGKGGGLAAMGGGGTATDGVLGGRQASTFLVRASWGAGAAFMVLALILAILSSRADQPGSILQQDLQPTAPTPVLPGSDVAPPAGLDPVPPGAEPGEGGAVPDGL
jgi:preprotein translocase subunit SecG